MKEKKRVLRILNRFNLGGPVYNATYLTKYLEDDYETLLIGGGHLKEEENAVFIPESMGIKPLIIPSLNRAIGFSSEIRAFYEIKKIIKDFSPDIVHTHASKAGAIGRLAAHHSNVKSIVHTYHGHVFEHYFNNVKTSFIKATERYLSSKSDAIIAISDKQKNDIVHRFNIGTNEKVHMIPLGFELAKFESERESKRNSFREKYKVKEEEIVIGIIGRMAPIKNHPFFLEQFAELKKKHKHIKAVVIGDGESKNDLIQKCLDLGLSANNTNADVIFTSWITNLYDVLPGIDIVALTSLNEGTPVSLIEAQAAFVPVISSDVGGVSDVVSAESAFLFNSNDGADFIKKCSLLIMDQTLRNKMGAKGHNFVMSKFTAERLSNDMKKLYLELLNRRS